MENKSLKEFIEVLGSKNAVPGGGGAASLVAAIGISLSEMVSSLTIGKKKYADVEDEVKEIKEKCQRLEKDFLELINQDAEVFLPLSKAYSLPKETEEEIKYKDEVMEKALLEAVKVPLEIMKKCEEAVVITKRISEIGSKLAISDAGCAAITIKSALESAALNVYINTSSMKNVEVADKLDKECEDILNRNLIICDEVYKNVLSKVKRNG